MSATSSTLDAAARVVEMHTAEKVDGFLLDAQTAHTIMTVAGALSTANRAKLDAMSLSKAATVAWKLVR